MTEIEIEITDDEQEEVELLAISAGQSLEDFVREAVREKMVGVGLNRTLH